jgi:hypothetical protein
MDSASMNTTTIRPAAVPASAILSAWHSYAWRDGIQLDQLAEMDRVTVRTRHSIYEIILISPASADIMVRGGEFFPEFTRARLAGCTLGGSFLKLRSIHVGFHMEFALGDGVIITSPVRTIAVASGDTKPPSVM